MVGQEEAGGRGKWKPGGGAGGGRRAGSGRPCQGLNHSPPELASRENGTFRPTLFFINLAFFYLNYELHLLFALITKREITTSGVMLGLNNARHDAGGSVVRRWTRQEKDE